MGGKKDQGKKSRVQDSAAENDKSIERSKQAARMRRISEFHLEVVPSQQASDRLE